MRFSAGIPLIFEAETEFHVGVTLGVDIDMSQERTIEYSFEQELVCKSFPYKVDCYALEATTIVNMTAKVTPIFYYVSLDADDTIEVNCGEYGMSTDIVWEATTNNGYETREIVICDDTPNSCDQASYANW